MFKMLENKGPHAMMLTGNSLGAINKKTCDLRLRKLRQIYIYISYLIEFLQRGLCCEFISVPFLLSQKSLFSSFPFFLLYFSAQPDKIQIGFRVFLVFGLTTV